MRTKNLWQLLSGVGLLGLGAISACSSSDTNVGSYQGPVQGSACTAAGAEQITKDGCNTCTCGGEGRWICTDKACPSPDQCKVGDSKPADDGCNTCSCQAGGSWACTEKACLACRPGETKPVDCNTCSCTDTGQWACTKKACVPDPNSCPAAAPIPDGTACTAAVVWAKSPSSATCCMYGSGCQAPAGWTQYNSQAECDSPACPAAAVPPPGTACLEAIVYAKDPASGACCYYADSCGPPEGWKKFGSESECSAAAMCPAPSDPGPGISCPAVIAYAKDPVSGSCCMYSDPCRAPESWKVYYNEADCSAGK